MGRGIQKESILCSGDIDLVETLPRDWWRVRPPLPLIKGARRVGLGRGGGEKGDGGGGARGRA
jgi:hypothetical protein